MNFLDFTSDFGVYALGGIFWFLILALTVFAAYGAFTGLRMIYKMIRGKGV